MSTPVINPTHVNWVNPTQALAPDGSQVAWDANTDLGGVEIQLDGVPVVSAPVAFGATSFDLTTISTYQSLPVGSHTIGMAVVTKEGAASKFTDPVTFLRSVVPFAPTGVTLV